MRGKSEKELNDQLGKIVRRSTKVHAHDAEGVCQEGDVVRISETRPMSRTKNWRVVEIVTRAAQ